MNARYFSPDVRELIRLFDKYHVRYLIVGGEAVIYYGHPRLTGDVDLYYDASLDNCQVLFDALLEFWGGEVPGIEDGNELSEKGIIFQFGSPPNRIDLINDIEGVSFEEAWEGKTVEHIGSGEEKTPVYYIGLIHLIRNKEAAGRPRDLDDLAYLRRRHSVDD